MIDEYCSFCSAPHFDETYPKTCVVCKQVVWDNPKPVVVCVQSVIRYRNEPATHGEWDIGLLIAKRAIDPHIGKWALIGGHIENGETVEQAAIREFREELGIAMGEEPRLAESYANGKGHVLIAVSADPILWTDIANKVVLCSENSEWGALWNDGFDKEMCFPIHARIVKQFFENQN